MENLLPRGTRVDAECFAKLEFAISMMGEVGKLRLLAKVRYQRTFNIGATNWAIELSAPMQQGEVARRRSKRQGNSPRGWSRRRL